MAGHAMKGIYNVLHQGPKLTTKEGMKQFVARWHDAAAVPVYVCFAGGVAVVGYFLGRVAFKHPDNKYFNNKKEPFSSSDVDQYYGYKYYFGSVRTGANVNPSYATSLWTPSRIKNWKPLGPKAMDPYSFLNDPNFKGLPDQATFERTVKPDLFNFAH